MEKEISTGVKTWWNRVWNVDKVFHQSYGENFLTQSFAVFGETLTEISNSVEE